MLDNYSEAIAWLFKQFPSYQEKGASAYKPGLESISYLLELLDNPQENQSYIHVAGTNGKGSTCAYINSILIEKGQKVGLFTSPHLFDFRERIKINGVMIGEEEVLHFCSAIKSAQLTIQPSFFEITFAMALVHFKNNNCQISVIETGLGGRLDATNVLKPILSIITPIALDHQQFLGNTLEEIALEKAGIIKENVPVLINNDIENIRALLIQVADKRNSTVYLPSKRELPYALPNYQLSNLNTAMEAIKIIDGECSISTITQAFKKLQENSGHFGRFQILQQNPTLIADVSHNPAGMKATIEAIEALGHKKISFILGSSQDKPILDLLHLIPKHAELYLCAFKNERSMKISDLKTIKEQIPQVKKVFEEVNEALAEVLNLSSEEDLIVITGSFFLIADLKYPGLN
jgi:dihydrofolate synthase/folylpolyglutamate synthase